MMPKSKVVANLVRHLASSVLLTAAHCFLVGSAQAQVTTRVSVSSSGVEADFTSTALPPVISENGRYVAFISTASNLVPGDLFFSADVFLHDRWSGTTSVVSNPTGGAWANGHVSNKLDMSADGRYIVFLSRASNLVPNDTNASDDVFVYDQQLGTTICASLNVFGVPSSIGAVSCRISGDGRYVGFYSGSKDIDLSDSNSKSDVFLYDMQTGQTEMISKDSFGNQGDGHSKDCALSRDGRYVAFGSSASNLVSSDTNGDADYFVRDRLLGSTERINVDSFGKQVDFSFSEVTVPLDISDDGRFVVFDSRAGTLVPGDTNDRLDTFVRDRLLGTTERISVDSNGNEADYGTSQVVSFSVPQISGDGRYVVFLSGATNLVPGDTNMTFDVFVRDRKTGITENVHINSLGEQAIPSVAVGGFGAGACSFSSDGRYVVFDSRAINLVPNDTNKTNDIFVHDRMTGGPEVTLTNVFAGQTAQLSITGGDPGDLVILGASLTGQGILPTAWGPLELAGPLVFFAYGLDGLGGLTTSIPLPPVLVGLPLWVQGVDLTMDFPTSVWAGWIQ